MIKAKRYTLKGTKTEDVTLPKDVFDVKPNMNLLAQASYVYEERAHIGLRKAKTRSEVNRTTKKVYKQKGTGGARHGSRRAPIYVGGGVALGPRPIRRELNLSASAKGKSKVYALSAKAGKGDIVVISGISKIAKTKEAAELIKKLSAELKAKRFTVLLSEKAGDAFKCLRNLKNVKALLFQNANARDIVTGGTLLIDEEVFETKKEAKK